MLTSKMNQRLLGLVFLIVFGGATAYCWYTALTESWYSAYVVVLPFFAVLGLGVLVFPLDKDQLRAEHGVDKPEKWAHYPRTWKLMVVVAIMVCVGNMLAIMASVGDLSRLWPF